MHRTLRALRLSLLALALAAAGAGPATAARGDWTRVANQIAGPWPSLQRSNGDFRDYTDGEIPHAGNVGPGTRYGNAVLGLALIQRGLRRDDSRLIDAGMGGIAWALRRDRRHLQQKKPSVFESMAVAAAYNIARRRLRHHPVFVRKRAAWLYYLRHIRPVSTILRRPSARRFTNHYLAEAIEVFELRRTGVRSSSRGALAGPGLGRAYRIFRNMVNHRIPLMARRRGQHRHGVGTFLLSDPPDYPLAYQGLATGLYAQAIELLGRRASPSARATLRRAANASWLLSAPDGDIGWFGRSMEESFGQSGTALAAQAAANQRRAGGTARARYLALRDATLGRLRDAHGEGPRGYAFIPALKLDGRLGARALEPYAGAPSFTGLTLLLLNWTLAEMPARERPGSSLASARNFHVTLAGGDRAFTTVRHGSVWFAVRGGHRYPRHPGDMRYDGGLLALKHAASRGSWRDVIPLRPLVYSYPDSAGPVLLRGGARGLPFGNRFRVRGGAVTMYGGFRTARGTWLRRHVRFRYVPTACGVRVAVRMRRGDRVEYSSFLRQFHQDPTFSRSQLTDSIQRVTASPRPGAVHVDRRRYYSASDPKLRRARLRFHLARSRVLAIDTCAR